MRSVIVGIVGGMVFLCSHLSLAQDVSEITEHVPASVSLALVSADLGQTCAEFQQTRLGQTLTGPDFQPLVAELRRRQLGGPLNLRPWLGFDWGDLQQAHVAGGLFFFPVASGEPGWAWVFGGASPSGGESPLAIAAKYFGEQGFRREAVKSASAALTLFSPPASLKHASTRVLFTAPGCYGVANSRAAAETLLNGAAEESLAADPLWQQQRAAAESSLALPGEVHTLLRPLELWTQLRESDRATDAKSNATEVEPQRDPVASSRQLGFDGMQALAGQIAFPATGTLDWKISLHLVAPPPYAKALRLLALQPGPMPELPAYVPADITRFSFWRWDFPTAMGGFGNLFDEANEPGPNGVGLFEDMLDGLRDDPEGVQVDLRREVFAQLGPEIALITDRQEPPSNTSPNGDRTLYVVQVRDVATVARALNHFYDGDDRVTHVRDHGYDIWTVPEGASLFIEGESDAVLSVRALALGEKRILFGTDEQLCRSTLSGGLNGDRLNMDAAGVDLWQQMKPGVDATAALWSLARLDEMLAPGYAQAIADSPQAGEPSDGGGPVAGLWRILLFGSTRLGSKAPLSAVPSFDRLRPSLPLIGTALSPASDGWNITLRALRREE